MDKYEYNLKLDQMKNLCAEERYEEAAEIADTINWNKVKNVNALVKAGEAFEKAERYQESRDVLLMAYDRSPIGRMIIYRLAEVAVKMKDFTGAQEYYDEFVKIAPHDNLRYVLQYDMKKGQGASIDELISVLEEFKEQEYIEEWAYELAYLYHKAERNEKCVDACDELILWFGDGPYVERALELKMLYQPLTKQQEDKYRRFRQEKDGFIHISPKEMERGGEIAREEIVIPPIEVNTGKFNTVNLQQEIVEGMKQIMSATETSTVSDTMINIKRITEEIPYLQLQNSGLEELEAEEDDHIATDEEIDGALKIDFQELLEEDSDGQISMVTSDKMALERQITGQLTIQDVLDEWERTRRLAEIALHNAEQKKLESAKARALKEAEVLINRLETVKSKLDAGVSPKELLEEEYMSKVIPLEKDQVQEEEDFVPLDKDELQDGGELIAEEQGVEDVGVSEIGISESDVFENEIPENEIPENEIPDIEENEDELSSDLSGTVTAEEIPIVPTVEPEITPIVPPVVFPKIEPIRLQKAPQVVLSQSQDNLGETETPRIVENTEAIPVTKEDIRKINEVNEADNINQMDVSTPKEEIEDALQDSSILGIDVTDFNDSEEATKVLEAEDTDLEETNLDDVREALAEDVNDLQDSDSLEDNHVAVDIPKVSIKPPVQPMPELKNTRVDTTRKMPSWKDIEKERFMKQKTSMIPEVPLPEDLDEFDGDPDKMVFPELTERQKSIFSYFVPVKGMEDQLCKALTGMSNHLRRREAATCGNLIIQGEQGCGKTVLATSILKVLQEETGFLTGKVGKIDASSLNQKDLKEVVDKVKGGCLIIEKAGDLNQATVYSLALLMAKDVSNTVYILEDTSKGIRKVLAREQIFTEKFTEQISVPIFTNEELVVFARAYSNELGYKIDDMAELALHNRISNIQRLDQATTLTEVKEIVDEAIDKEAHGGLKKAISILTAKRYTEDDKIVLTERVFE